MGKSTVEISAALGSLRTAIVSDVLREMGMHHQVLHHSIRGLVRGMRLVGPAFCIKGQTMMGGSANIFHQTSQPKYEMFRHMYPGCVLVYATDGYDEAASWGDNINISVKMKGCAGLVVDGGFRDAEAIVEAGMSCFGRFITPVSSAPRFGVVEYERPVVMPGQTSRHVTVDPGDFVLGDFDGVVVVPRAAAERCTEYTKALAVIENKQFAELERGDDRQSVYERYDRFGHIEKWTG